jgi:hypothetical protein
MLSCLELQHATRTKCCSSFPDHSMPGEIIINLAVEDELSEYLLRILLQQSQKEYIVGSVYRKGGFGYLKRNLAAFNNASSGSVHLVLADLDQAACAPSLIEEWFGCTILKYRSKCHRNLLFKVVVREIEGWVMADRNAFSKFLGINRDLIPNNTETLSDPKASLIDLVRRSRYRSIRDDIAPKIGEQRRIGPNYNTRLSEFLRDSWHISRARDHSASLARLSDTLNTFHPLFCNPITINNRRRR